MDRTVECDASIVYGSRPSGLFGSVGAVSGRCVFALEVLASMSCLLIKASRTL